jgi:hypothetical protein
MQLPGRTDLRYFKRYHDEDKWVEISFKTARDTIATAYYNASVLMEELEEGKLPQIGTKWATIKVEKKA